MVFAKFFHFLLSKCSDFLYSYIKVYMNFFSCEGKGDYIKTRHSTSSNYIWKKSKNKKYIIIYPDSSIVFFLNGFPERRS